MLHPEAPPRVPYVEKCLRQGRRAGGGGDRLHEGLRRRHQAMCPPATRTLGTDGFGRSDYRRRLRSFFEVDRYHVAVAALKALADDQLLPSKKVAEAIKLYNIDPERASPALS